MLIQLCVLCMVLVLVNVSEPDSLTDGEKVFLFKIIVNESFSEDTEEDTAAVF